MFVETKFVPLCSLLLLFTCFYDVVKNNREHFMFQRLLLANKSNFKQRLLQLQFSVTCWLSVLIGLRVSSCPPTF